MKKFILIMSLLLTGSVYAKKFRRITRGKIIKHEIQSGKELRRFSVFLPHSFSANPEKKQPLIINFHAFFFMPIGQMIVTGMNEEANRRGYVVAYPRAGIGIWNNGNVLKSKLKNFDDIGFTRNLIKKMIADYNIDPDRIYVTGYSSGALMAYRVAAELSDLIAAFAVVAGSLNVDVNLKKSNPVPLIHIHGVYDGIVPLLKNGFNGIKSAWHSIKTWIKVNKTMETPKEFLGVLRNPRRKSLFKIRYKKLSFLPKEESGGPIDFYQLRRSFHIVPISMHRYTNPLVIDFFAKFKRGMKTEKISREYDRQYSFEDFEHALAY